MGVLRDGLVQVFYGSGKGKTSCAIGGAVRLLGHGGRVLMVQMLKSEGDDDSWFRYGELRTIEKLPGFEVRQMGMPAFIKDGCEPCEEDRRMAVEAMAAARREAAGGEWDMMILDEVTEAWNFGLVSTEELIEIIDEKHAGTELVLTGRFAPDELVERADLVTELKAVKHPFERGVKSRKGIEY